MSHSALDELQSEYNRRVGQFSDIEREQLNAVFKACSQRLFDPQQRQLFVSLSAVLQELPYRPSDRLIELVELLDEWFAQPKFELLIDAIVDQARRK